MTKLEITLSDDIARKAAVAGLLSQEQLEVMLSERLGMDYGLKDGSPEEIADYIREIRTERREAFARFKANAQRMQAAQEGEPMTPEAMADDIRAWRSERRKG